MRLVTLSRPTGEVRVFRWALTGRIGEEEEEEEGDDGDSGGEGGGEGGVGSSPSTTETTSSGDVEVAVLVEDVDEALTWSDDDDAVVVPGEVRTTDSSLIRRCG